MEEQKELTEVWLASWDVDYEGCRYISVFPSFESAYRELVGQVDEWIDEGFFEEKFTRYEESNGVSYQYTDHDVSFVRYTVEELLAKG